MKQFIGYSIGLFKVNIKFDVYLPTVAYDFVAAKDVDLPSTRGEIDPLALENFNAFVESVEEILDYYDFRLCKYKSSELSTYAFYTLTLQIKAGDVPKYVRLRISSHVMQHQNLKHKQNSRKRMLETLQKIKLPSEKVKQRYMPIYIIADRSLVFDTYEEALNYTEESVRKVLEDWLDND